LQTAQSASNSVQADAAILSKPQNSYNILCETNSYATASHHEKTYSYNKLEAYQL
jgi:hypothetical protein